jgi:gliding motility-associated protein GldC
VALIAPAHSGGWRLLHFSPTFAVQIIKYNQVARESTININVSLDDQKVPQAIQWTATDSTAEERQQAKAMMVNFWDAQEKSALRIDLWTGDMMVDEMADFYFQCLMGMADTFQRSTGQTELVQDMKKFAQNFYKKFQELQAKQK